MGNHPIPFPHCLGWYCYSCNDLPYLLSRLGSIPTVILLQAAVGGFALSALAGVWRWSLAATLAVGSWTVSGLSLQRLSRSGAFAQALLFSLPSVPSSLAALAFLLALIISQINAHVKQNSREFRDNQRQKMAQNALAGFLLAPNEFILGGCRLGRIGWAFGLLWGSVCGVKSSH